MIEHVNEFGTEFQLYDATDICFHGYSSYLYHFVNKGGQHGLMDYVDCHHLTEAMVAAPSYNEAMKFLTEEELGSAYKGYIFEVNLVGLDLMPDEGKRILFRATKRPID